MTFLTPDSSSSLYAQDEASAETKTAEEVAGDAEIPGSLAGMPDPMAEPEEVPDTLALLRDDANVLWTCLAAFLVFFMQAGFALVETGFTRAKNACNLSLIHI